MNILLINHYAGSLRHGMEYRPYYLAREWVRGGHQVTIVAASFSHVRSRQPESQATVTEEQIDGIRYLWLRTPGYSGNGIGRVLNMSAFLLRLWLLKGRLVRSFRPDVVIASSTYPMDIYPASSIARKAGGRLIYEVHDLWPLSPIELGGMSPKHPFIRLVQAAEDFACRRSDVVVSMLPCAKGHMEEHGMVPEKFVHIPNGIDVDEWSAGKKPLPQEHASLLQRLRSEKRLIVCYAGAHGIANALYVLIGAAQMLSREPVAFVLVGQGPEKVALQTLAAEQGLQNICFLPPVPKSAMPALLGHADVLYIGLQARSLFRFGISPNKLMDYMMAARPVISAIRAGNDMVADSGCGISVAPESPDEIAAAVKKLLNLPAGERDVMGQRGREYVQKYHDYRVLAARFEDVMKGKSGTGPGT